MNKLFIIFIFILLWYDIQKLAEITVEPKEASFSANERIAINCKAHVKLHHHSHKNIDGKNQRHQKQVLNWYKDDEPIKNYFNPNSKHKIEITNSQNNDNHSLSSILIIHNSREEDSGKYVCVYDNYSEQTKVQVLNEGIFFEIIWLYSFLLSFYFLI